MRIVNETPFPAQAMPGTGPEDKPVLSVVVKGTFQLVNGQPAVEASEMLPLSFADELVETGGSVLPLWESDLAPFKPRADVLLVGKAYAPAGKACQKMEVRVRVGHVDKTILVLGQRLWAGMGEPRPSEPKPFDELELSYAHAFGGIDQQGGGAFLENPAGTGFIADKTKGRDVKERPLPRIEDPSHPIKSWKDRPSPVGLGALGRGWASRARHLGTYDERWQKERAPLPPRDFSFAFHNCAARDQQVEGYLEGDEAVEIVGATKNGRLSGRLPGIRPALSVRRMSGPTASIPARLDTVLLMPDRMLALLVWRGVAPIPSIDDPRIAEIRVSR